MQNQQNPPIVITQELACGVIVKLKKSDIEWIRRQNRRLDPNSGCMIELK